MPKIVVNRDYGGFGLSKEACDLLEIPWDGYGFASDIKRDDPKLVEAVETLGSKANGAHAKLAVVVVPDDVDWEIEEYNRQEWVAEKHRTW